MEWGYEAESDCACARALTTYSAMPLSGSSYRGPLKGNFCGSVHKFLPVISPPNYIGFWCAHTIMLCNSLATSI